jgi:Tfp pilus assembly protein PilF
LLAGQLAASSTIYKEILEKDPNNKDALFGLATAYHKNSQFDQARDIYTKILEKDHNNKEVLNNFLVLVSEEAPEDALIELQKLERINSDFSPIPAQIAMIYLKMNNPQKAERYLRRAVILSPDNITYKYNLAITSDRLENHRQAIRLYRQIVEAVQNGAVIPGSIENIQERLTFLEESNKD